MGGSQLSQLKAALHTSGLSRQSGQQKKQRKQHHGKSGGFVDEDARKAKLQSIRESMNKFDVKTTKTKHSVLGAKPAKGSTGRPGLSKQTGIDNRRKTLLPQWLDRSRTGAVVDRRFGEDDPTLTPEEKALQRFTFERQRKASKSSLFTLNDDDADGDATGGNLLTHYGQNLSDVRGALADQEDLFQKSMTVRRIPELDDHSAEADSQSRRKKTKAEVMEEVMAKSKAYKYERQREKHEDEEMRHALDDELAGIRGLLGAPNRRQETTRDVFMRAPPVGSSAESVPSTATLPTSHESGPAPVASTSKTTLTFVKPEETTSSVDRSLLAQLLGTDDKSETDEPHRPRPQIHPSRASAIDEVLAGLPKFDPAQVEASEVDGETLEDESDPYDRYVRELAFEKRAAPSDRLKTETEAAFEAAEALKRSEAARLKRMHGEESNDEDQSDTELGPKRARKKRATGRLPEGDDLDDDYGIEGDEVGGFTLGLGTGLGPEEAGHEDSSGSDGSEVDSEEEEEELEDSDSEASVGDLAETELLADLLHRDVEVKDLDGDGEAVEIPIPKRSSQPGDASKRGKHSKGKATLPFTFPCPETHEDFLDLVAGHESDLPTVVERIRTLYHPSLGEGNKQKLANFLGVLIDEVVHESSHSTRPRHLPYLSQQVSTLSQMFPISSASYFLSKFKTMQRNLLLGLQAGPALDTSRTWPGAGEITLLRLAGLIWSTSDFAHQVTTAAALLIAQYLGQCRVRNDIDIAAGLMLGTISAQYEAFSKRFVPEVVNFLTRHMPSLVSQKDPVLHEQKARETADSTTLRPDILGILCTGKVDETIKQQLCLAALDLSSEVYSRQTSLPSFEECFAPLARALEDMSQSNVPSHVKDRLSTVQAGLSRAMRIARAARRPLTLQSHKPVPIPTYIPKFDSSYAPGRRFDPDSERNEAAKLKALVKKERKGAIRELRKDSRFLAGERAKMQAEKDREYKGKIDKITAGLQEERHEEKRFERTKEREKLRDKKRSGGPRRK